MLKPHRSRIAVAAAVVLLAAAAAFLLLRNRTSLPEPGSQAYEQFTRAFHHGLAALEVGLLDDALTQFTRATELVPEEPAAWANLGLTQLRRGELDAAAPPIQRALELAPDNAEVVLLAGRMETARGRLDAGVAHLRRAADLAPRGVRARFALAEEVERAGGATADADAQALLDELVALAPGNLAVLLERGRLAARRRDAAALRDTLTRLEPQSRAWPEPAREQYAAMSAAAEAGRFEDAARASLFLRNVLARVPAFIEGLAAVRTPTELIAEPFATYVAMTSPSPMPSPADHAIAYTLEPLVPGSAVPPGAGANAAAPVDGEPRSGPGVVIAMTLDAGGTPAVFTADAAGLQRLDAPGRWPFAAAPPDPAAPAAALAAIDWNNDFRSDIVVATGGALRLMLQDGAAQFSDATAVASTETSAACACTGVWAADVEMDGDLDIVAARADGAPLVLQNNGNGTWREVQPFPGVARARAFAWGDLDDDADPDAVFLDAAGALHVFINGQAGQFAAARNVGAPAAVVAAAIADIDANGTFDVLALDRTGVVTRITRAGADWERAPIAEWQGLNRADPGTHRLLTGDLDNNGALDLVAAGAGESRIWLAGEDFRLQGFQATPEGEARSLLDLNADGHLDLAGVAAAGPVRLLGRGQAGYHWMVVRARGQQNAGDQRINSFGVGGQIEVRAGLLVQKQVLTGVPSHFGLGNHTAIDVARIVWPNGVPQAEFDVDVDDAIVAEQRLKGSCPWVFAWDGARMGFVNDFLWRSPLGLRINAQDTAGVVQTEDWVRITGTQLAPRNGTYDLRITAELWETHFFDHVSLLVVDHPAGTDVFVDERFSASRPPAYEVRSLRTPTPVADARDHRGASVTDVVAARDGRYLATFERGAYQGIAREHFVEFALGGVPAGERATLLATGWIYPTDSSINVAIGQGGHVRPMGVALEVQNAGGGWDVIEQDLGFPAGKNKTMVVELPAGVGSRRLRLRTNLEIAWDALAWATASADTPRVLRLPAQAAELRYRGFSASTSPRGEAPETPSYEQVANRTQRWRDLEGYHTRFGDVRELLAGVDDRYVIMNAGDEMQLRFAEPPAPPAGWERDFVLVGDGWEKDGDYNTGFSQTVLPLPAHDTPHYGAGRSSLVLEEDPVYQRHKDDWQTYHTRYVTPARFIGGLSGRYARE